MSIAELNDQFRTGQNLSLGKIVLTTGIQAFTEMERTEIFALIQAFDDFSEDNDPYGEHDFGKVEYQGSTIFWKIDYYDPTLTHHSEDKANPEITVRVLTIMLASEY